MNIKLNLCNPPPPFIFWAKTWAIAFTPFLWIWDPSVRCSQEATKSSGPFGYIGSFKEGLGQGIGIALFPDGEEYSGEIVESMPQGYGVARLRGRKGLYAGQWQGGTRHGWAVSTLLNGALWAGTPLPLPTFPPCALNQSGL